MRDPLHYFYQRAMELVEQYDHRTDLNEAVRYQEMCDKLQQDYPMVSDKRVGIAIQFYLDHKRMK